MRHAPCTLINGEAATLHWQDFGYSPYSKTFHAVFKVNDGEPVEAIVHYLGDPDSTEANRHREECDLDFLRVKLGVTAIEHGLITHDDTAIVPDASRDNLDWKRLPHREGVLLRAYRLLARTFHAV